MRLKEGPFANAYANVIVGPDGSFGLTPPPQVGLRRRDGGEYDYFLVNSFPPVDEIDLSLYDTTHEKGVVILPLDSQGLARDALRSIGLPMPKKLSEINYERSGDEEVCLSITTVVTETIKRTWAKIAFNYLAYFHDTDRLLSPALDQVRRFVRYGQPPVSCGSIVSFWNRPILGDEPPVGMRRLGHIITVERDADGKRIYGQVSLYNQLTYRVLLVEDEAEARTLDVPHGHFYNLADMEVSALFARSATVGGLQEGV